MDSNPSLQDGIWQSKRRKSPQAMARPALHSRDHSLSHQELADLVQSAARTLRDHGVERGDRILIFLPNSPEYVVGFLAGTAAGAIVVPVDHQAGAARVAFTIEDTTPRLCLRLADGSLPTEVSIPTVTIEVDMKSKTVKLDSDRSEPIEPGPLPEVDGDAEAVILFTAGSTGFPKGAVLKHRHLLKIARTLVGILELHPDHRDLILAPMTHSGGWQRVTSTLLAGGCVFVPEGTITIPSLLEDIRGHRISGFFAPPPLLRLLMTAKPDRAEAATANLRSIESASAPVSAAELERLLQLLPHTNVFFQYGLTECSRACILDTRAHPQKLHTVGLPTEGVEVKIAGPDGESKGPDEEGEICLSAPQRTESYWNRPELNRERFQDRWLRTGDVGSLDTDGFLTFRGRRDDRINCGGLSYFPSEVENELGSVEGVAQYLIVGVPDPQGVLGQVPWAFVVPRAPEAWSPRGFAQQARNRLAPHMIPRRVVVIPSIPMISSGKPDRRALLERHAAAAPEESGSD